jgi:predicted RND superfamily exporter protein
VGGSLSLVDYLKRMHVVTHDGDERLYRLPEVGDPKLGYSEDEKEAHDLIAAYMYLYSQGVPEEFNFIMTYDYRSTNLQVFLKDMEAETIREILRVSKEFVRKNWESKDVKVGIAGGLAGVVGAINEELRSGMVENMVQISLIVFLFCIVLLRSFVGALIVLISLFTRVIVVYGVMGFAPIPLTLYTMPVASLGIGIGVDYVIYVLVRIQEEYARRPDGDIQQATVAALTTTGKAVFYTAMSVVLGVLVFAFSPLKFQFELGSMIGLIIFLNGLGAIALISPIVFLVKPGFIFKKRQIGQKTATAH